MTLAKNSIFSEISKKNMYFALGVCSLGPIPGFLEMWQSHFSIQQSHELTEMGGTKMNFYNDRRF
jgi:hypothetical protein